MVSHESSVTFDPYYQWLGIPPQEQPANYYRLLGIDLFEANADVISVAADRQMAHVKTFGAGRFSEQSQQVLNELATARLCLLNGIKKQKYDSQLRLDLAVQELIPRAHGISTTLPVRRSGPAATLVNPAGEARAATVRGRESASIPKFTIDESSIPPARRYDHRRISTPYWRIASSFVTAVVAFLVFAWLDTSSVQVPVAVRISGLDGAEAGPTPAMIVVECSQAVLAETTVQLSIEGNVDLGTDAVIRPNFKGTHSQGSIGIPQGMQVVKLPVTVVDDSYVEGDESMTLTLTSITAENGDITILEGGRQATITISDNDRATVSVAGSREMQSAQLNQISVPLVLSQPSATDIVCQYSVLTTYRDSRGTLGNPAVSRSTFTIPAGSTSSAISLDFRQAAGSNSVIAVTVRLDKVVGNYRLASINRSANSVRFKLIPTTPPPAADASETDAQPDVTARPPRIVEPGAPRKKLPEPAPPEAEVDFDHDQWTEALDSLLNAPEPAHRARDAAVLGHAYADGEVATQTVDALLKAWNEEPDSHVREAIVGALGSIGEQATEATPLLRKLALDQTEESLSKAAADALLAVDRESPVGQKVLRNLLSGTGRGRVVGVLTPDSPGFTDVDRHHVTKNRMWALGVIRKHAVNSRRITTIVIDICEAEAKSLAGSSDAFRHGHLYNQNEDYMDLLLQVLGQLGKDDSRVLDHLVRYKNGPLANSKTAAQLRVRYDSLIKQLQQQQETPVD